MILSIITTACDVTVGTSLTSRLLISFECPFVVGWRYQCCNVVLCKVVLLPSMVVIFGCHLVMTLARLASTVAVLKSANVVAVLCGLYCICFFFSFFFRRVFLFFRKKVDIRNIVITYLTHLKVILRQDGNICFWQEIYLCDAHTFA